MTAVILHHLMDASKKAVSAETIAIVVQPSGKNTRLVVIKSKVDEERFKHAKTRVSELSDGCKSGHKYK